MLERITAFLRRPGVTALLCCLCIALGFFSGSLCQRQRSAGIIAVTRAAPEEIALPEQPAPVNINTADAELLQTLPGIGPALAERIVEYRELNGGFAYLYELTNVTGIGSKTYEGLRELITLD